MTTEFSVVIFLILYLSHPANIRMEDSEVRILLYLRCARNDDS